MSFVKVNRAEIVKKQYKFKLQSNMDAFSSLIGIQLLAVLFSLGGVSSMGGGDMNLNINVKYYSSDLLIVFTMLWSFVTAITITTKPYRNHDFSFVTNRVSSSLSNILFLLTSSILGSMTALLGGNLVQVLVAIFNKQQPFRTNIMSQEFLFGIGITFLYVFLISSLGYLIGTLVQISKGFIILIPVLVIGSLFLEASLQKEPFIVQIFQFYFMETAITLFIIKALISTAVFFTLAMILLNRMEVRR